MVIASSVLIFRFFICIQEYEVVKLESQIYGDPKFIDHESSLVQLTEEQASSIPKQLSSLVPIPKKQAPSIPKQLSPLIPSPKKRAPSIPKQSSPFITEKTSTFNFEAVAYIGSNT